jgi:hypothetical protein
VANCALMFALIVRSCAQLSSEQPPNAEHPLSSRLPANATDIWRDRAFISDWMEGHTDGSRLLVGEKRRTFTVTGAGCRWLSMPDRISSGNTYIYSPQMGHRALGNSRLER